MLFALPSIPKGWASALVLSLILGRGFPVGAQARETDEQVNIRVYRLASPAVVSVRSPSSTGSGTIIDSSGLIVTSGHVVGRSRTVEVTLADGRKFSAQVTAVSFNPDLALLRLNNPPASLPTVSIAPLGKPVLVGQRAFAIGNPFGKFAGTLTTGIISRIDPKQQLIQTDALLNPGNSGGPLLDSDGELIGVNSAIFALRDGRSNTGLGFAISSDRLRQFLADVQAGRMGPLETLPTLQINAPKVTASFSRRDETLPDGSYFQVYEFQGRAGQSIVIEMHSQQIDPYMVLFDPKGRQIADDDDSGGGKNALIRTTLPMTGTYTLYVNSYEAGKIGSYTLSIRTADDPKVTGILLQKSGVLGKESQVVSPDGSLFDLLSFEGKAGQTVQITLTSSDFHPYLILYSPDQRVLREHNGLPDRRSAVIKLRLPTTGIYRVVANSFTPQGRGRYELIVREVR